SDDEVRLIDNLFTKQGYNALIRPVQHLNESLIVAFNMALIQLINVDEKNQIVLTNVWLRMMWHDYQLKWDPYEYGGIGVIRMPAVEVWKPDIVLFNNADGRYEVSYKSNVVLSNDGKILWIPPAIYKSSCTIDVEYFPFDEQECHLKFGSWTFNGDQVRLDWYDDKQKIDLSDYVFSGTWDIMSCPGNLSLEFDQTEGYNRSYIIYSIKMRRKTLYYTTNLILPCILISFLSMCVFLLPAEALEKMTLCISILLALVVFLLLVSKILPPTSLTVPLIEKYLLFTFIMNLITIFITVFIINYSFRTPRTHKMPSWIRNLFLNFLPRLVLLKRPNHDKKYHKKAYSLYHHDDNSKENLDQVCNGKANRNVNSERFDTTRNPRKMTKFGEERPKTFINKLASEETPEYLRSKISMPSTKVTKMTTTSLESIPLCQETIKALEAVKYVATQMKNNDDYMEVLDDWRYVALVIDRLLFFIFLSVTVCGSIGVLINAPFIFEYVDQDAVIQNIINDKYGYGEARTPSSDNSL
ncbi:hypothetical protein HELRODRAFT_82780, partial [Helobdella robusta]|uniref:Uncharacterized protein n=1 Tax=Helobdella robusta TaxID=6412 RepID=T1G4W4_HELRO